VDNLEYKYLQEVYGHNPLLRNTNSDNTRRRLHNFPWKLLNGVQVIARIAYG
jgi:hypothetical protein